MKLYSVFFSLFLFCATIGCGDGAGSADTPENEDAVTTEVPEDELETEEALEDAE